jgi:hypothetical protein
MIVFYSIYVVNFQRNENVPDSQDIFEEVVMQDSQFPLSVFMDNYEALCSLMY